MILFHFLISTSVYLPLCQISWPCRQRLCASFATLLCLGRHCPLQQDSRAVWGGTLHRFSVTKFREFCKDFCEILNWGCWRDWDSVHAGTKHFSTGKSRFRPKCWNAQELKATESVRCRVQVGFFLEVLISWSRGPEHFYLQSKSNKLLLRFQVSSNTKTIKLTPQQRCGLQVTSNVSFITIPYHVCVLSLWFSYKRM